MSSIDDPSFIFRVGVGLSTKLEAEILDDPCSRAIKRLSYARQIGDYGLDSVAFAFDLETVSVEERQHRDE